MSNNQLFKYPVENSFIFDLLDKICQKTDKFYIIDQNAFRKMLFHKYETDFCNTLLTHYYSSKHFYLTRKLTYKSFTNIIRQICKHNNILFNSSICYSDSRYTIVFYIYY
jgi:hypothetical protein